VSAEVINVLMIDDDPGDFEMTRSMLGLIASPKIYVDWAPTFQEGVDALSRKDYQIFLVDYFLEDGSGIELLEEARSRGVEAPLIMLTGRGTREVDLQAMRAGAADYLVKGEIDHFILERAIRYALDRFESAKQLAASQSFGRGLQLSADRYEKLAAELSSMVLIVDRDGMVVEANEPVTKICRVPMNRIIGQAVTKLFAPKHRSSVTNGLNSIFDQTKDRAEGVRMISVEDDQEVEGRVVIVPIVDRSREVDHALILIEVG
jgi:DNA-binding response OmpR family regulator